ncbi:hypothetical protein ACFVYV_09520 [Streptomyces mirabilis]|uniref:hypothetical protein n=1 Tax=Streptomyces mirabilis TaxID=68239 RepID=UPI0036DACCD8
MYTKGDRVTYVGNLSEVHGVRGVVQEPSANGRVVVEFPTLGAVLDMSDTVLEKNEPEENEMAKSRKTTVTHPDGTVSMRASVNNIYIYAVEQREDVWATAKLHRAQAQAHREEKTRFIAAVRAGRIAVRKDSNHFDGVYLLGENGEEWWLGADYASRNGEPLDRKAAIREWLANADRLAGIFDRDADKAEGGPQYAYSVVRWSMSHENAHKGVREFKNRNLPTSTFRVVPAEAAE